MFIKQVSMQIENQGGKGKSATVQNLWKIRISANKIEENIHCGSSGCPRGSRSQKGCHSPLCHP